MTALEKAEATDGRRVRGAENRRKIVEAMLALIGEGAIAPGAEMVAARAEVGLRTVFRHFDDMESLYREISARMNEELMPIAAAPLPEGDGRARLNELAARRARVFERMMPFKIAADVHKHRSRFLTEEQAGMAAFMRASLIEALGPELARDKQRLEALDMLLSFDVWRRLRVDQNLTVAQAKKLVAQMVDAVFDASDK
ncbi:MAG: TetR/AcrR family transcriptional regulator [Parvibaculum sp.]|nr:TetR/AcrR family transcriptional regulator [Parvibaculum sp.]